MIQTQARGIYCGRVLGPVVDVERLDIAVCSHHIHLGQTIGVFPKLFEATYALRRHGPGQHIRVPILVSASEIAQVLHRSPASHRRRRLVVRLWRGGIDIRSPAKLGSEKDLFGDVAVTETFNYFNFRFAIQQCTVVMHDHSYFALTRHSGARTVEADNWSID